MEDARFLDRLFDFWTKKGNAGMLHLDFTMTGKEIRDYQEINYEILKAITRLKRDSKLVIYIEKKKYIIRRRK